MAFLGGLVAVLAGASAGAASAASPSSQCLVRNGATRYSDLATAISAASVNATLSISGTCTGTFTVNKNLTLAALGHTAVLVYGGGGGGQQPNAVLTVQEARVMVRGITITGGPADGVANWGGNLTLYLCDVYGNGGSYGTGVYNDEGNLNLVGSNVYGNDSSDGYGGGIDNYDGAVTLSGNSFVGYNEAQFGGGIENHDGSVTLNDGSGVVGNDAALGGGIDNYEGTVTLNGHSAIDDNSAYDGGGIYNYYATVKMTGTSTIAYNDACAGGGIYVYGEYSFFGVSAGVNVLDNSPDDIYYF